MPTTNQKDAAPLALNCLRFSAAILSYLFCLSLTSGCTNESTANLKPEDAKRIKGQKVTAEKLSPAQLQAAREEIGAKLSKTNVPTNVPRFNPASVGKPK